MASLLVVIVVAAVCGYWVWLVRVQRRRWLARLDLPGTWDWQDNDGELVLDGDLDGGAYRLRDGDAEERGEWRLEGHDLVLERRGGGSSVLDLRLFDQGKIGIHGAGREHRVYVKARSNVVPLRRPA
ncbi:MAG: hypothetical protein CMQ43_08845 [Gammaproteobacteria bacterium]|nr:hypothetical protein [Gammaproteobacteria bacterium]|tara:strand:- start:7563 stop:7943 length:381 start_codon:yes stop_codon:yes gene_type:complete